MKLLLILILNIILTNVIWAQNTFCKIFDLDPSTPNNIANDLKVLDNNIILSSTTFRKSGKDSIQLDATNLTTLNLDGTIIKSIVIDSFSTLFRNENLTYTDSIITISGKLTNVSDSVQINQYNMNLNRLSTTILDGQSKKSYYNFGHINLGNFIYIYGILSDFINQKNILEARLVKMNSKTKNIIWERSFKLGNYDLECNDLQPTTDGNFAFILFFSPAPGAAPDEPTYKIIKINPEGVVLDSFQFIDSNFHKNRLLSSKDGSFYFSSQNHPINGWDWSTSGRINKLNPAMDSLEWNVILPNNALTDGRIYRIEDYIETKNGELVVCGRVRENSDSKVPGGDLSSTWNGFIVRLNTAGKIIWLRIYRMPQEILDISKYGPFRPSILKKIVELESGDFIAFGDLFYNNLQASGIDFKKDETNHLWLIRVNASGCLDGYPCDTIIRIRPSVQAKTPNYNIGTQWTFETDYYIGGGHSDIKHTTFKITDTVNTNGKKIYYLNYRDSIYFENGKMFFWDEKLKSYEMYYDFNSTSEYEIKYYVSKNNVQIAKVKVDSVYNTIINLDTIPTQLLRISNNGSFSDDIVIPVYKNIGASYYEIKLYLGKGFFDPSTLITKLRCFKSDAVEYNFQNYPCDSTWFTTNTTNLDDNQLTIIPNPTSDYIQVRGIESDLPYGLYNIHGQKISSGISNKGKIHIPDSGVFILKIKLTGGYSIHRILRL